MSTVTKGTQGTAVANRKPLATGKNAAAETARKQAQAEWAQAQLGNSTDKVVVVPVFELVGKKWNASEEIIRQGNNPEWGSVMLMAPFTYPGSSRATERRFAGISNGGSTTPMSCLISLKKENWGNYTAGELLTGRIDTEFTTKAPNPKNLDQDVYFINAEARAHNIPACDADGEIIYAVRYWENDLSQPKPAMIEVANREDILAQIAEING